jgi:hypothetical protein
LSYGKKEQYRKDEQPQRALKQAWKRIAQQALDQF